MEGKRVRLIGLGICLGLVLVPCRTGLGREVLETQDVRITPLDNGVHFRVVLPRGHNLVQANLEYWNGRIFEDAERFKTNRSFALMPEQKVLEFDLKDDPRIELNKAYLNFVIYFRFRYQDKNGNLFDSPEMVYYIQRTWYVKPAGVMVFFAQRRNAYWDKLPEIAESITRTVDRLYGLKQKKVFVLLYSNDYNLAHDTGMPGWAAALFWNNIWMRDYNNETRFIAEMAHEYTHYLQYENDSRIPLFFMEGMSDYTYFHLAPREKPDLSVYRTLLDQGRYLDPDQMFGRYPQEKKYINSFYKQGYLFVQYIADKLGPERFKRFIQELNNKALDQVVAATPEFAKMGIYGMWMEIRDLVSAAPPRPLFAKDKKYPAPVAVVNEGWKNIRGLSFSPDSRRAALDLMESDKNGNPKPATRLEIVDVATGKVERSREIKFAHSGLRWSPADPNLFMTFVAREDGTKIGIFSWKDRDWRLIGGEDLNVEDARWSPDGKRIGFVSDHSGASELYVMMADGTGRKQITQNIGYISSFNWLPDGDGFLVVVNRGGNDQLYRMKAPDFRPEEIPCGDFYRINAPQLSPDGKRLAFFAYSADLFESNLILLDLADGKATPLTRGANVDLVRWLDDKNILFGNYDDEDEKIVLLRYPL